MMSLHVPAPLMRAQGRTFPKPGLQDMIRLLQMAVPAAALLLALSSGGLADDALSNPFLGDPAAIEAGKDIYRGKCYGCHHSGGARGPNLFATKLSDERFLETVINGRKGTQMPAFGLRLSPDEVWQVHAYVKSTDHYE
jgi:mono/diheme cytochrome c family protein